VFSDTLWSFMENRNFFSPAGIRTVDRSARGLDTASTAGNFSSISLKLKF